MSNQKNYTVQPCQLCGQVAPCMQVSFSQNIGVIVLRFSRTVQGMLCRPCIDSTFIKTSAISAVFGWWGVISFFYTLFTLPMNVVTWGRAQTLPQPSAHYWKGHAPGGAGGGPPAIAPGPSQPGGFGASAPQQRGFDPGPSPPGFGAGAPGAHGGFGPTPSSAPAQPAKPGPDLLAFGGLAVGAASIGMMLLVWVVGIGMMVSPHRAGDQESGLLCLLMSAVACGGPGLLGLGMGAFRLLSKSKLGTPERG